MPDMEEIKGLLVEQGKAWEEYKATNDRRLKEVEKKSADVVTVEKIKRIDDALTDMQEKADQAAREMKAKLLAIETLAARPNGNSNADDTAAAEQKKRFINALRKGEDGGVREKVQFETKDMTVTSDSAGGYFVPITFVARIIQRMFETTPMRDLGTVMTISSDEIEFPNNLIDIAAGWVGETQARPQTTSPQPGKIRIPANELYAAPQLSQKILDDAFFDVESWLINLIADKLSRLENNAYLNGTGGPQPRGMLNYTSVATDDATRAWGQLQYVPSGASGTLLSANPGDCLITLTQKLKVGFLKGASWLIARDGIALIRQAKNQYGGYLWQPNYQAGQPSTLLDYPVTIAPDLPAVAANSIGALFGNFKEGYTIVDRMGIRMLRDPYTVAPEVRFYTTKRVGGDVVNFEAIKALKLSVS